MKNLMNYSRALMVLCASVFLFAAACASRPLPEAPLAKAPHTLLLENAEAYFYISGAEVLKQFGSVYGISDDLVLSRVHSATVSVVGGESFVFIRTAPSVDISDAKKRARLMYRIGAAPVDESFLVWSLRYRERDYLINIAYENGLLLVSGSDAAKTRDLRFVDEVPEAARFLEVSEDHAFWMWVGSQAFRDFFRIREIRPGHAAVALREYSPQSDVLTDIAFPYESGRVGVASLKLMLPFLFQSIEADTLGSLPGVEFRNGLVSIRRLRLPQKIVTPLVDSFLQDFVKGQNSAADNGAGNTMNSGAANKMNSGAANGAAGTFQNPPASNTPQQSSAQASEQSSESSAQSTDNAAPPPQTSGQNSSQNSGQKNPATQDDPPPFAEF